MYSITAALVLFSPCVANRIQRDFDTNDLNVHVNTSAEVAEPLQTLQSLPQGAGDPVDWHFMTNRFTWAGRDEQEEFDIVQGHTCQGNGYYDQSYYAASLCYWTPENNGGASEHWGLSWRGGYGPREFCGGLDAGRGVCARCSVCHDNSRDRNAQVDSTDARMEIIPLPECMMEGAIEAECNQHFDSTHGDLLGEEARCREVQGRYVDAVANFDTLSATIAGSEASITNLVHNIATGYPQGAHCPAETIQSIRGATVRECRRFGVRNRQENSEIMRRRPTCELPVTYVKMAYGSAGCEEGTQITNRRECEQALQSLSLPLGPAWSGRIGEIPAGCSVKEQGEEAHMHWNERSRGRGRADLAPVCRVVASAEGNRTHARCEACTGQMDTLQAAIEAVNHARAEREAWLGEEGQLARHQHEITGHRNVLSQSYQSLPHVAHVKTAMENEWHPQQEHCQQVYGQVVAARNAEMMACAPRYYDRSCEKACVEIQRSGDHGCGVVEGSQYGDEFQRGGVEVTCSPPAPSWIMSPYNYGGSPQPNSAEQCGRINAAQSARATTPVLMSGWLTRPGSGWFSRDARRFYVLESGNGVRSATLRSFTDALPDGTEESGGDDGIIMWDAEEVSATETTAQRACFEIKHRYEGRSNRWYRRGTTTTKCVEGSARLRDQWVSILQGLLVWRPRVA